VLAGTAHGNGFAHTVVMSTARLELPVCLKVTDGVVLALAVMVSARCDKLHLVGSALRVGLALAVVLR
jgi:hypothetical protein